LDFKTFDLVISSATGAFFPNALNKKSAKLVCYCHTPPRYLYHLPTAKNTSSLIYSLISPITQILFHFYRLLDFTYAQNVDQFIANSQTTAARIQKFYRKDSVVINPPVFLPKALPSSREGVRRTGGFYLTGGRLAHAKRFDIAIRACNQLKLPLKIFGRDFAGCRAELERIANATRPATAGVEFVGEITQEQKSRLYSQAQAYLMCSDNEDFGIVSVEAMAHGCPVIGYRSGGIAETVIDGRTGILFDQLTPTSCISAIKKFQKTKFDKKFLISHSQQFSRANFIKKIKHLIPDT
jgi:glycosyltransferase involved in cell wall biosynthesis